MEFTSLNTEDVNAEVEWHMVTAPCSVLKYEKSMKREGQLDQLEREFYSLPRAHFLRPGYFCSEREPSAFSPYSHDLHVKGKGLQDQSPRDSESYGCIPPSSRPHPLAQPGFYSPKIVRAEHSESTLSTKKYLKDSSLNINRKDFYSHTLPLPRSKIAVLKQSGQWSKPQGIKTSVVEKPRLMRAVISPDSNQLGKQQYNHQLQHLKKQGNQNQYFSSQDKSPVNLLGPEIPKKKELVWNHHGQSLSKPFQPIQNQSSFRVPNCSQDSYETLPQNQSSVDHPNMHLKSACYCQLRSYNGNCIHNAQDSVDHLLSRQLLSNMTLPNTNLKDLRNKKQDSKVRKDSNNVGNITPTNTSQVDINTRNVFGQPRVVATLRAACSPRPVRKNTIVEDLKKLIVMDDTSDSSRPDSLSPLQTRTNSSLSELLQSSTSSSLVLSRPSHLPLQCSPAVGQPMSMESAVLDRDPYFEHGLLPLPNTVHDLDWNSLVNAAEAYEMQRMENFQAAEAHNMLLSGSPVPHSPAYSDHSIPHMNTSVSGDTDDVFTDLPDQLSHLEVVLRRLSRDLLREKKDKVALLAEVLKLRMSNQQLKEESLSANAQLNKICQIFNTSMYESEEERK